jgi:hypothetical protein
MPITREQIEKLEQLLGASIEPTKGNNWKSVDNITGDTTTFTEKEIIEAIKQAK